MTTTTESVLGYVFSAQYMADGWYGYINGGDYPASQQEALVDALCSQQEDEFNAMLPEGCRWLPSTSGILHPVDAPLGSREELEQMLSLAAERVSDRFAEIETAVLGTQS